MPLGAYLHGAACRQQQQAVFLPMVGGHCHVNAGWDHISQPKPSAPVVHQHSRPAGRAAVPSVKHEPPKAKQDDDEDDEWGKWSKHGCTRANPQSGTVAYWMQVEHTHEVDHKQTGKFPATDERQSAAKNRFHGVCNHENVSH
eukprot:scaffold205965_cov18-Tisochrysis_lutea.AAC.1